MEQYISKSALAEEIERWIKHYNFSAKEFGDEGYKFNVLMEQGKASACERILSFLDTLEVKEVDLDKEIDLVEDKYNGFESLSRADIIEIIKYFFELGLIARQARYQDSGRRNRSLFIKTTKQ